MPRWKRRGLLVVLHKFDHPPRHVHVFEDRQLLCKFDIGNRSRGILMVPVQSVKRAKTVMRIEDRASIACRPLVGGGRFCERLVVVTPDSLPPPPRLRRTSRESTPEGLVNDLGTLRMKADYP